MKIHAFDDLYKKRVESASETARLFARAIRQRKMYPDFEPSRNAEDQFKPWTRLVSVEGTTWRLLKGKKRAAPQAERAGEIRRALLQ